MNYYDWRYCETGPCILNILKLPQKSSELRLISLDQVVTIWFQISNPLFGRRSMFLRPRDKVPWKSALLERDGCYTATTPRRTHWVSLQIRYRMISPYNLFNYGKHTMIDWFAIKFAVFDVLWLQNVSEPWKSYQNIPWLNPREISHFVSWLIWLNRAAGPLQGLLQRISQIPSDALTQRISWSGDSSVWVGRHKISVPWLRKNHRSAIAAIAIQGGFHNPWRIHGAGIYANMTGVYWW